MYELDKAAFGHFLAQLRREKGMTQKELAATLYVSDKAVSKWERGLSVPDISLLVPLAEQLNVTVAELLQGREYILVTLGAPGSHITEQFNIQDAISVYRKLETKMSAKR